MHQWMGLHLLKNNPCVLKIFILIWAQQCEATNVFKTFLKTFHLLAQFFKFDLYNT